MKTKRQVAGTPPNATEVQDQIQKPKEPHIFPLHPAGQTLMVKQPSMSNKNYKNLKTTVAMQLGVS